VTIHRLTCSETTEHRKRKGHATLLCVSTVEKEQHFAVVDERPCPHLDSRRIGPRHLRRRHCHGVLGYSDGLGVEEDLKGVCSGAVFDLVVGAIDAVG
jgi:hypothetical protein